MAESQTSYRYLRPEDVRRLGSYEFAAKMMVEGYMAGRHRSRQRGSSIEFHEYRPYTEGDDPGLIDWRVFARTDRTYLKTFEQETDLECHLFLDSSASMGFPEDAEMTKLDWASFFAACLAYLVVRHNDRVSLGIYDEGIRKHLPPGSTKKHLHELLTTLENNQPGGETSLSEALRKAVPLLKRKGTLVVMSDFMDDPTEIFAALNPYIARGFRIHLFHVLHPDELELPKDVGLRRFEDLETGDRLTVHPDDLRKAYGDALQKQMAGLRGLAARRGVDYALARTDTSYLELFDRLVAEKGGRG